MSKLKPLAAVLLLLAAAYCAAAAWRLASAESLARRDTIQDLQAAERLTPGNADLHARVAVMDASRGDELAAALALNPRQPSWLILRSVRQEEDGDLAAAEQSLLRANDVSRYYIPRWSLAAFYYRQGDRAKFSRWARPALSVGYGAPESLLRMAQKLDFSPAEILDSVLPPDRARVENYLWTALQDDNVNAADLAARRLLTLGDKASLAPVLDATDALFRTGDLPAALDLWNAAAAAHWVDLPALHPDQGVSLAADRFRPDPLGRAFDWRFDPVDGVERTISDALQLEFSGKQPERCELATQNIALKPAARYRLTIRYRADGIPPSSGLRLEIWPLGPPAPLSSGLLTLAPADVQSQSFEFQTAPQSQPLKLVLAYARAAGTTRIEGRLWVESIKLQLIS